MSSSDITEGRPHGGLQLLHEESGGAGAELCSLGTVTGPEGAVWSWDRGEIIFHCDGIFVLVLRSKSWELPDSHCFGKSTSQKKSFRGRPSYIIGSSVMFEN